MRIDPILVQLEGSERAARRMSLVAGALTVVNIAAALVATSRITDHDVEFHPRRGYGPPPDLFGELMVLVFVQAVVNGLVLMLWHRTRHVGFAILCGTILVAIAGWLFLMIFVAPNFA